MNPWPCDPDALMLSRLPAQLAYARDNAPAYRLLLAKLRLDTITDRDALARLPLTRKSSLIASQAAAPPFGGYACGKPGRVFASPGPIYEPMDADSWRMEEALTAAGFSPADIVHNGFAYHLTPGGFIFDSALQRLGATVFPGGPGNLDVTLAALHALAVNAYVGTPSFLQLILDAASQANLALRLEKALVSGEAPGAALIARCQALGIRLYQCYASAELGLIAYQSSSGEGMRVASGIVVEICDPDGRPVAEGEAGELVVTSFSQHYPLVRFATGDISAFVKGSRHQRIRGWLGRADDTVKVRGLFVHPEQVRAVLARHPGVRRARLLVTREQERDQMTLQLDAPAGYDTEAVAADLKALTRLSGRVELTPEFPDQTRLIEDCRVNQ